MIRAAVLAGLAATALILAAPAFGQATDPVVAQARANGLIGEQTDGYLGFAPGADISADLRGRVNQINIQRRALYTRRASASNVSVEEMAYAVACDVFENRIAAGERYRDEAGRWRQRTATEPAQKGSRCP
ncbi:MAG: YdbL family protein [Caulobacteraceae bacterium]